MPMLGGLGLSRSAVLSGFNLRPIAPPPAPYAPAGALFDSRSLAAGAVSIWTSKDGLQTVRQPTAGFRPSNGAAGVAFDGVDDILFDAARSLVREHTVDLGADVTCTGLASVPDGTWWVVAHPLGQTFANARLHHYSADFSQRLATIDLEAVYGTGADRVGGVQGIVYDRDDGTLRFITGTAGRIMQMATDGTRIAQGEIAFGNGNGLAIDHTRGELIALQATTATNPVLRRIDKATGATIASTTLNEPDLDHLFFDEPTRTLLLTAGNNGGVGRLIFYNMDGANFYSEIARVNIPETPAIEGIVLRGGKAYLCNDALSHEVGPANTVEVFYTGTILSTLIEGYGVVQIDAFTPTDALITLADPVSGTRGWGIYPRSATELRIYLQTESGQGFNRTWTGLPNLTTAPRIVFARLDKSDNSARLWVDGVERTVFTDAGSLDAVKGPITDRQRFNIGAAYEGADRRHLDANVRALGYSLIRQDRQKVEGWLAHEFGIAGQLPSEHPFRNVAP